VRTLVLEGDGFQIYQAKESPTLRGKLIWNLKESNADLHEVSSSAGMKERARKRSSPMKVRLSEGAVWSTSDGSTAIGEIEKTTPSPETISAPWVLFKVTKSSGQGILSGQSYIQRVYTHAGRAPAVQPKRSGEITRVPYRAQYWFYQLPRVDTFEKAEAAR